MTTRTLCLLAVLTVCLACGGDAEGRGFGGFRAGGFSAYRGGSFGGYNRGFSYAGSRSVGGYSGYRGAAGVSSYDRSWAGSRGGSINVEGARGAAVGPRGGVVAGGGREVTATGPGGRTYSGERMGGVAAGPYGRVVGGGERAGVATGPRGAVAGGWQGAFAGTRFPTDVGLSHYSSVGAVRLGPSTTYWSRNYVTTRGAAVRTNFGYYHCFRPAWYTAHPGAWYAAGWTAGAAWTAATWASLAQWCAIPAVPVDYDYGNTVIYQNNNVYVDGENVAAAPTYASQAVTLADQGQKATPPAKEEWKPLGVFALVQGDERTSNNLFQLAVNRGGTIRGNYYDGLTDTTTPVFGSIDKKTQRAAWTIGKKQDRVFEAGVYNLTQDQAPVLVHLGKDRTQQWLLVRVEQPSKE